MSKLAYAFALTVVAVAPAAAEEVVVTAAPRTTLGIDGAVLMPVGDSGELATGAGGARVRLEVPVGRGFVTGRGGVLLHAVNDRLGMTSLTLVPIYAGYRHPIGNLYLAGELGLTIGFASGEVNTPFGNGSASDSDTDLGLTLGVGYRAGKLAVRGGLFSPNAEDFALLATVGVDFAAF